ncbi:MAG: dihydrofolate reductase [Bdellovibrionota bacterium]
MNKPLVKAIVAMTPERVIGKVSNGVAGFPQDWNYPTDIQRFKDLTAGQPVLMGRTTYESIPADRRPLPNRLNIVVSRTGEVIDDPNVLLVQDPLRFIRDYIEGNSNLTHQNLWIIGGGEIYKLTMPYWDKLYLTTVKNSHLGNVYFPEFADLFEEDLAQRLEESDHSFRVYRRK